jgi:hypothetical protein
MSLKDRRRGQRRVYQIFAIVLAFVMGASLLVPLFSQNLGAVNPDAQPTTAPTQRPTPTVPPAPDTSAIAFTESYLHPAGIFTAAVPTGWEVGTEVNNQDEAQVTLRNPDLLSLVEARILQPADDQAVNSAADLGAIFDENWLRSSWREYTSWDESTRRVDQEADQLIIDFTLSRSGQDFIARHVAYTDQNWVYVVRAVTPSGSQYSDVLRYIIDNMVANFAPVAAYTDTPLAWNGYFDEVWQHLIRYPADWQVADAAPGVPASITGSDVSLRVEAEDIELADEAAAEAYVAGLRPNIDVLSVTTTETPSGSAYRVAYSLPTLDGPSESGVVLLLPGESGLTHVANLRLSTSGIDFNSEEAGETYADILGALNTLGVFPDLS